MNKPFNILFSSYIRLKIQNFSINSFSYSSKLSIYCDKILATPSPPPPPPAIESAVPAIPIIAAPVIDLRLVCLLIIFFF